MKNFAITGVAGYIAPRHLKAIKETNNSLVAALDPHDSVGVLDSYFNKVSYFCEFERFERYLDKLRRENSHQQIDYLTICSPNHLHDAHARLALNLNADAICEKPLVLNPWNLDALQKLEEESSKKIYTVLQLRQHPTILKLKEEIEQQPKDKKHNIVLTYITSRGIWYHYSWKGDQSKSGGIGTNIGIHFFDMLHWIFGELVDYQVHLSTTEKMSGFLEFRNANIKWYLSIDENDLPKEALAKNQKTYRSISIDNNEVEFTDGFTDLHTQVYKDIIAGNGFGIEDARQSIETAYKIRNATTETSKDLLHPLNTRGEKK